MHDVDISILNEQTFVAIESSLMGLMERTVAASLKYEGYSGAYEVSILLVDDETICRLNDTYRGKNQPTDVLSFPQWDEIPSKDQDQSVHLGDVVISVERAAEQAKIYGHDLTREMCFLTAHSMFHLFGYDHETEEERKEMRIREEAVLDSLSLTRNLLSENNHEEK